MLILIVDDMTSNRKLLVWMLEDEGHETIEAGNGEEALRLFEQESPDMVLLDIIMPVMDGYEAAQAIKNKSADRYVPIIFLTALNDEDALAKCLASGGDDFLTKPFNEMILRAKINAHGRIQDLSDQVSNKNQELLIHQEQTQREHEIVEHVFQNALSESFLSSGNINYYLSPMSAFNGDVMLASPNPSGGLYIMLGDFTGHGLSAAVGSLPISRVFFAMAKSGLSIGDIAAEMNSHLEALLPDYMFCAATLIELNAQGNEVVMWCGGLPDAVLVSSGGELLQTIESMHMPLGALDDHEFERGVYTFSLEKGTRIYLHSDGIIESTNGSNDMFGEERFYGLFTPELLNRSDDRIGSIMGEFFQFTNAEDQDDDISLMEVICQPVDAPKIAQSEAMINPARGLPWKMRFELSSGEMRFGDPPSAILTMIAAAHGMESHKDYLHTILTEMYLNSLEHGVLGLDSGIKETEDGYQEFYAEKCRRLESLEDGKMEIVISYVNDVSEEGIKIWVRDSGEGFDFDGYVAEPAADHSFGRGISLIRGLCDGRVNFKEGGRVLEVFYSTQV
ncbi:MAG: SpoIIE family protein phosphatase [Gammaproteobacteria bacterium]|nr:SpoIIE family protein phosphatase [Gammaproteobacteria bacterium]